MKTEGRLVGAEGYAEGAKKQMRVEEKENINNFNNFV